MDNRRKHYRHHFNASERLGVDLSPRRRIRVELDSADRRPQIVGQIFNLSLSGMLVRLTDPAASLENDDQLTASFAIPPGPARLVVDSVVVHSRKHEDGIYYGLRFLPLIDPAANDEREKVLWQFLTEEQRRQMRALQRKRK